MPARKCALRLLLLAAVDGHHAKEAAHKGNPAEAGLLHQRRRFVERAAEQGHAQAWYGLGAAYATGNGVPSDLARARFWLRLASAAEAFLAGAGRATGASGPTRRTLRPGRRRWTPSSTIGSPGFKPPETRTSSLTRLTISTRRSRRRTNH